MEFEKVSIDELKQMRDLTDWKRVKEMTSEEIEANAQADSDCLPTDDDFWGDATVVQPNSSTVIQSN
ncbi:MAG: hypothetical protein AAGA80_22520 [Cyanobacteria bacterium P01_F01_bin.143]